MKLKRTQRATLSESRNGAAPRVALNLHNLSLTSDFYRANSWKFPLRRIELPKKLLRRMRPTVKRIADRFNLTQVQARSVLMDLGFQLLFGVKAPGKRARS